jgi:hypothetical protein
MSAADLQGALGRIGVVMPSCDRYASLWPVSLTALDRYWAGRPAATYVVANHRACTHPGVASILVGDDRSWSDNLITALASVPQDYVFLALDDLVMLPGTDAPRMNRMLARAVDEGWDYLRVNPLPAPAQMGADGLGRSAPGEAYRSATVWSLWRKEVLLAVLKPGENAWQFEKTGSERTDAYPQWWASGLRNVPYLNVVTAGRADPDALRRLQSLGFDVGTIDFPPMNAAEYRRHRWRLLRSKGLKLVPRGLRRAVLNTFAKP